MKKFLIISLSIALTACASIKEVDKDTQNIPLPNTWQHLQEHSTKQSLNMDWWTFFHDNSLNNIMTTALNHNTDIAVASLNLKKAFLQADLSLYERLPKISIGANRSVSKPLKGGENSKRSYQFNSGISFQLDLFGKLAKEHDVKKWLAKASIEDAYNTWLAITSKTASLYWQLGLLNRQIILEQNNINKAQQTLNLIELRYKTGAVSQMDVLTAKNNLLSLQNALENIKHEKNTVHASLAILLGQPPETVITEPDSLPDHNFPELDVHSPASILANRPDVKSAEMNLKADFANYQVSQRALYPNLTLNLTANGSSNNLANILTNPIGSAVLNILMPIFNWPENQLNLKVSKIQYKTDLLKFRDKLYTALSEVENAYSEKKKLDQQYINLQENLNQTRRLEKMHEIRYQAGADSLQDLLDTQENTRKAELSLLDIRYQRYTNFLTRYLALGGVTRKNKTPPNKN